MDKGKWLILIGLLFLMYILYSLFSGLDSHTKSNSKKMKDAEESIYETTFPDEGPAVTKKIVPTSPTTAEVVTPPESTPQPRFRNDEILPNYEQPEPPQDTPNYGRGESNFLAVCYTHFVNCRARDVMFNYPSEQYPWSQEADDREVECITFSKYCLNDNFQTITPEDELRILNQYHQERNQVDDSQDYRQ